MKRLTFSTLLSFLLLLPVTAQEKYFDISKSGDIYNAIWRELDINYVDSLDYTKLNETAIAYMLNELDPYTVYIPESKQALVQQMTSGEYGGIGAVVSQNGKHIVISEPYFGKPAQRNDLRAGDIILEVDGKKMVGASTATVSQALRGTPGTEIRIKVERDGEKRPLEKRFMREAIQMDAVSYYGVVGDKVGYIRLSDFTDKAFTEFKQAVINLTNNQKVERLIIDLRDNGGGLVQQAVDIAGLFLPKNSLIVEMKDKTAASKRAYRTTVDPIYGDMPLAVLVNDNSASASEILAGAMQDLDRAVIFGERTFGKGLVQSIRQLPYNGYLKVTTAKYYIPSGRCVQAIDYARRGEDDRPVVIPDSLTTAYKTANGRTVRDGAGILPDVVLDVPSTVNISYYLYMQNVFFNYANQYVRQHAAIAAPATFELSDSDYEAFCAYVKEKNFTYRLESEKYLQSLNEIIKSEGYDKRTEEAMKQLTALLQPQVEQDLKEFRDDVAYLLVSELMKRYYFQHGIVEYQLRSDKWVARACDTLLSSEDYAKILEAK